MTNAQWWYMEELKRKTRSAEADRDQVRARLERVNLDEKG